MSTAPWIFLFLACFLPASAAPAAKPLEKLENCTFVSEEWADGDSFRIKTANGEEHTIRLYGVDCLELHVAKNDRNLTRLREQRRYFGITDVGKDNDESMKIAAAFAKEAADFTAKSLQASFTVHTRFSNGGGDPRFNRILGFITLTDGTDLGSMLVKQGLARAQGIISTMPDGMSVIEARGMLEDWEIQALKNERGIWAKTNWEKLPVERQLQRKEKAEAAIAKDQNVPNQGFKLNPNNAARDELMKLPGIGEEMANRIIEKQPYEKPEDLLEVTGIGLKKLEAIRPFLDFSRP